MIITLLIDSIGSGGAQNQIIRLAKELASKEHTVIVIYYHESSFFKSVLDQYQIAHILLNKNKLGVTNFLKALRKNIIEKKITHIISYLERPNFYAVLVKLSMRAVWNFSISFFIHIFF